MNEAIVSSTLIVSVVLGLAGMLTHQLKQFIQLTVDADGGNRIGAVQYWTHNWPQTALSLIGTTTVMLLAWYAGDLNPVSSYLAGLAGNTAAEAIGSRTLSK